MKVIKYENFQQYCFFKSEKEPVIVDDIPCRVCGCYDNKHKDKACIESYCPVFWRHGIEK